MHSVYRTTDVRREAALQPGEIVWAAVYNGCENVSARGKSRPVILVSACGSSWQTMGLTTNPRYRHGGPRTRIPHPKEVGLTAQGFLWGQMTTITGLDIDNHVGWCDEALAHAVIEICGLTGPAAEDLLEAARIHHPKNPHRAITGSVSR